MEFINLYFMLPTPSCTCCFVSSPPPHWVGNLVKVQCSQRSVLWELESLMSSSFPQQCTLLRGLHPSSTEITSMVFFFTTSVSNLKQRAGGLWWGRIFCLTSLHRGQHFIKYKLLTHGLCLERWKQAHYVHGYCTPAALPWKHLFQITVIFTWSHMLVLFKFVHYLIDTLSWGAIRAFHGCCCMAE